MASLSPSDDVQHISFNVVIQSCILRLRLMLGLSLQSQLEVKTCKANPREPVIPLTD